MSCAKQLPRTRSCLVVESDAQLSIRSGGEVHSSRKIIPSVVLWLTLEMLGEPELTVDDTTTMVRTARGALDDLRWLVH